MASTLLLAAALASSSAVLGFAYGVRAGRNSMDGEWLDLLKAELDTPGYRRLLYAMSLKRRRP